MRAAILIALIVLGAPAWGRTHAPTCPVPVVFTALKEQLPAARAAVARQRLPILILGGSATAGMAAKGEAFTYPARLTEMLREGLPGVDVRVTVRAASRKATADLLVTLDRDLRESEAALVIWGPGGSAAARGETVDGFSAVVEQVATRTRTHRADLILMTPQYAPSVVRVLNLGPYRSAVINIAEMDNLPVLDRYEYMRFWNASGLVNLDTTDTAERIAVARKVFECLAESLAKGILDAVR